MTVTWRTATGLTATNDVTDPFGDLTYTLPTGHTTDDLLLAVFGCKPETTTASTPTGYTACGSGVSASDQTFAADTGNLRAQAFYKVHDGSETDPISSFTAQYSPGMVACLAGTSSVSGSGWAVGSTTGSDDIYTGSQEVSAVGGSLTWATGDEVVVVSVGPSDTATETSASLSIANVTVGALTEVLTTNTTTLGNDGSMHVYTATVSAGGTGAPTFTATSGGTGRSIRSVLFIRITEPSGGGTTPVSRAVSTSWHAAATVARARSTTWHALAAVAQARATSWHVAQSVAAAASTSWHTLAAVAQSRATTWHVRASVAKPIATTWHVLTTASAARSTSWHVAQQVAASASTSWHVASSLVTVARAMSTTWHTRALVAQPRATTWHVRAAVAAARSTAWHILTPVATALGSSWHVLTTASAARSTSWRVRALVGRARSTVWHVGGPQPQTTGLTGRGGARSGLAGAGRARGGEWR